MKIKLTSLLLACCAVAASPVVSLAQEGRPPQEAPRPDRPDSRQRPDGEEKKDGDRKHDGERKHDGDRHRGGEHARPEGANREAPHGRPNPGGPSDRVAQHKHPGSDKAGHGEHRERPKAPPIKPVTYLGIMPRGVSPELASQLGLPEGFGLVVDDVMDGSPAKESGVQKYDVIVMLGDQRIVNAEQFQALVRGHKKGDEVNLSIRRKGAEMRVSTRLGERAMPVVSGHARHPMMPPMARGKGPGPKFFHHRAPDAKERTGEAKERMEQFRDKMRERLQDRGDDARRPTPLKPRPGMGPMNRDGRPGGPPPMNREGGRDGSHVGQGGPDGKRPGGDRGPRAGGPPGGGPRPDGPPQDGPRPNAPGADAPAPRS